MNEKSKFTVKQIVAIGLMAALVFVGTNLRIKIPIGLDGTMLHLGNVFCLLSGLLFGGLPGGLAAGIGSALFDLTSEYASEAWITFINKFFMGLVAGLLAYKGFGKGIAKPIVAAAGGSLTYVLLYAAKTLITQRFVAGLPWEGVWPIVAGKTGISLVNGIIAVAVAVPLSIALKKALHRAGLFQSVPTDIKQ